MGFFRSLFDLSFSSYVTVRLARWAYVATIILAALVCLGGIGLGVHMVSDADSWLSRGSSVTLLRRASEARAQGYAVIAGAPIVGFLILLLGRLAAEMTVVVFSIAESLRGRQ